MKNTITLNPVASSQIHGIGYDEATKTLAVQFKRKGPAGDDGKPTMVAGSIYHYGNVTPDQHKAFAGAESLGRHLGQTFKADPEAFPCVKCENEEAEQTS